jgi:hypothetical protein
MSDEEEHDEEALVPIEEVFDSLDHITTVRQIKEFGYVRCDACYLGDRCPYHKSGQKCMLTIKVSVNDAGELVTMLSQMIEAQAERVMRQMFIEAQDGGVIDPMLSKEIETLFKLSKQFRDLLDNRDEITIKAKGTGVISQLFGGIGQDK